MIWTNRFTAPGLVIRKETARENIRRMSEKCRESTTLFRPHFKTHQSIETGRIYREEGIEQITVSSLNMLKYFASDGWKDFTIAVPFNLRQADEFSSLDKSLRINILSAYPGTAAALKGKLRREAGVFIKIDTGYHRTGFDPENIPEIEHEIEAIQKNPYLNFMGFLTHAGHTYHAENRKEISEIWQSSTEKLRKLKTVFASLSPAISAGDTPGCSLADNFAGLDEVRPGNFVYYDTMQLNLGSCTFDNIAAGVCAPVLGISRKRKEVLIHCGSVHLSKDLIRIKGEPCYGLISEPSLQGWHSPLDETMVISVSQEHGIIKTTEGLLDKFIPGSAVVVIPVHSCLTVHAFGSENAVYI
jgi:D-serine deaminase-like pyridoxal phosphate-dependent protein